MPTQTLPLSEKDELKGLSLLTKPFLSDIERQDGPLVENLKHYKEHIAAMIKSNQKFEADVVFESLLELIAHWISPYLI